MLPELANKTAFVTGASRGVGQATAIALARAGCARLLLHYGSHREGAEATLAAVRELGANGELLQADLSHWEGIESLIAQLEPFVSAPAIAPDRGQGLPVPASHDASPSPGIDILVNNAGSLLARAKLTEFTPDLYDRVMNLNVKSLWFLSQTVARAMIARRSGVIVHLSSIAARNGGGPGATIYAAAKAAVACITKGMAKELAPHGIRVNAVSPGTVDNDFHARFSTREFLDNVVRQTPQGRLSTNEDMAGVILFLCSAAARNIIGQTLEVNGGMYMV